MNPQFCQTSENDGVATKRELWKPFSKAVGGFDLDPASGCEPAPIADEVYTKEEDGLLQPWYGTVWLNPPFSAKTKWYKRLVNQYWNGDVKRAVALCTVDPSAQWFHNWFSTADVLCFLEGRDWYVGNGGSPSFSTQVGVWNPTEESIEVCKSLGTTVETLNEDDSQTKITEQ